MSPRKQKSNDIQTVGTDDPILKCKWGKSKLFKLKMCSNPVTNSETSTVYCYTMKNTRIQSDIGHGNRLNPNHRRGTNNEDAKLCFWGVCWSVTDCFGWGDCVASSRCSLPVWESICSSALYVLFLITSSKKNKSVSNFLNKQKAIKTSFTSFLCVYFAREWRFFFVFYL